MVLRVLFYQVGQLHVQTLDLRLLVLQGVLYFFDLLLDQIKLFICQVSVLGAQLVKVEFLLPLPRCLHLTLLLLDGHVQDLVEIGDSL